MRLLTGHGFSNSDIARAIGADAGSVSTWLEGRSAPASGEAERLSELASLVRRLELLLESEQVQVWLMTRVPALGDERPIDRIARGRCRDVAALVSALESTTAS